jgi:hypothetical protein
MTTPCQLIDAKGQPIKRLEDVTNPLALPEALRAQWRFQQEHGARVNRATAMRILGIGTDVLFNKVLLANPGLRHLLPGETRAHYVTARLWHLLP